MKKNQALIRKLKTLSETSAPSVLADLKKLNHSKYISEAVSAIVEAPMKMRDLRVPAVLGVLSWLHRCYRTLKQSCSGGSWTSLPAVLGH